MNGPALVQSQNAASRHDHASDTGVPLKVLTAYFTSSRGVWEQPDCVVALGLSFLYMQFQSPQCTQQLSGLETHCVGKRLDPKARGVSR